MEQKDSDIMGKLNSNTGNEYFDEEKYSPWNKRGKKFGSTVFKVPEEIPSSWFVIGLLVFIILLTLFYIHGSEWHR